MKKVITLCAALALTGCAGLLPSPPPPNDPVTLRVNVFRGASNLPIYMAQEKGYFTRRGLTLQMQFTPNSIEQRTGLAAGRFDIAHAAVDNAVAMIEGAKADAVIVAGGDGGRHDEGRVPVQRQRRQLGAYLDRWRAHAADSHAYSVHAGPPSPAGPTRSEPAALAA
jgi:putative intracellular protease/amidase